MSTRTFRMRILVALVIAATLTACSDPPPRHRRLAHRRAAAAPQSPQPAQAQQLTGAELFKQLCQDCHRVKGVGGGAGPDLTQVAARANRGYFKGMMLEPDQHYPGTGMPSFGTRLTPGQLELLADYLNGLK